MSNQWNNKCPIIETTDVHSMKQQMSKQWNNKCLINETMSNQWNKCPLNETTDVESMKQQMSNQWINRCWINETTNVHSMKDTNKETNSKYTQWQQQNEDQKQNQSKQSNILLCFFMIIFRLRFSCFSLSLSLRRCRIKSMALRRIADLFNWNRMEKTSVWLEVTCLVFAALLPTLNEWQKPCSLACLN